MPAVSVNQRITAAIAKNHPEDLYERNKGMASMSKGELHKFASTPKKGLPRKAPVRRGLHRAFGR